MASGVKFFLTLCVLLSVSTLVFSLSCYQCGTELSEFCGENFDVSQAQKVECEAGLTECYALIFKAGNIATRGCSKAGMCDSPVFDQCKSCTDDFCNVKLE